MILFLLAEIKNKSIYMSNRKQMTIQEQKDILRFKLIAELLTAMGLCGEWVHMDRVAEGLPYILANRELIEETLSIRVIIPHADSKMWEMLENKDGCWNSTKTLLSLARRLAKYRYFAIVTKTKSIRLNTSQTKTDNYYRLLTP